MIRKITNNKVVIGFGFCGDNCVDMDILENHALGCHFVYDSIYLHTPRGDKLVPENSYLLQDKSNTLNVYTTAEFASKFEIEFPDILTFIEDDFYCGSSFTKFPEELKGQLKGVYESQTPVIALHGDFDNSNKNLFILAILTYDYCRLLRYGKNICHTNDSFIKIFMKSSRSTQHLPTRFRTALAKSAFVDYLETRYHDGKPLACDNPTIEELGVYEAPFCYIDNIESHKNAGSLLESLYSRMKIRCFHDMSLCRLIVNQYDKQIKTPAVMKFLEDNHALILS